MAIISVQYANVFKNSYKITGDDGSIKTVPNDPANSDYQEMQTWLSVTGNTVADPPIVLTQIPDISARQFYQQYQIQFPTEITQDEAYAAATSGALPQFIVDIINQLPVANQFDAKMKIGSCVTFERNNATTNLIAQLKGWTSEETDAFFLAATALL